MYSPWVSTVIEEKTGSIWAPVASIGLKIISGSEHADGSVWLFFVGRMAVTVAESGIRVQFPQPHIQQRLILGQSSNGINAFCGPLDQARSELRH